MFRPSHKRYAALRLQRLGASAAPWPAPNLAGSVCIATPNRRNRTIPRAGWAGLRAAQPLSAGCRRPYLRLCPTPHPDFRAVPKARTPQGPVWPGRHKEACSHRPQPAVKAAEHPPVRRARARMRALETCPSCDTLPPAILFGQSIQCVIRAPHERKRNIPGTGGGCRRSRQGIYQNEPRAARCRRRTSGFAAAGSRFDCAVVSDLQRVVIERLSAENQALKIERDALRGTTDRGARLGEGVRRFVLDLIDARSFAQVIAVAIGAASAFGADRAVLCVESADGISPAGSEGVRLVAPGTVCAVVGPAGMGAILSGGGELLFGRSGGACKISRHFACVSDKERPQRSMSWGPPRKACSRGARAKPIWPISRGPWNGRLAHGSICRKPETRLAVSAGP